MNADLSTMDDSDRVAPHAGGGALEARYLAFLETITHLRPSLNRYCSRMTGLVLDGEDIVDAIRDSSAGAGRRSICIPRAQNLLKLAGHTDLATDVVILSY